MTDRYKITVERITSQEEITQQYQKIADVGNPLGGGVTYGYVPMTKVVETSREVLRQEVEALDLAAVIKAVNGLV